MNTPFHEHLRYPVDSRPLERKHSLHKLLSFRQYIFKSYIRINKKLNLTCLVTKPWASFNVSFVKLYPRMKTKSAST